MEPSPRPAHRVLGRCLSGALRQPLAETDLPATETEWRKVLRRSSAYLVTPLLRWAFQEQGLRAGLPADVSEFIDAIYALNLDGNRRYEDQLAHLICTLNEIGVRPVLLKGAAALVSGLYPTSGERMFADIDVLVPASRLPEILTKLIAGGYGVQCNEQGLLDPNRFETKGHHHYYPLDSPDWPARVELHVRPVIFPLTKLLGGEEMLRDSVPLLWRGGECLLPSPTHFILHNVIHAFLIDFFKQRLPLSQRNLFEFVRAHQLHCEQIDWRFIADRFETFGYRNALRQYVLLSNAYFGFEPPPEINLDAWNRLWVEAHLFRIDLAHPAIEGPFALWSQLRARAQALRKNPERIKKLFTIGFYSRLWLSVIVTTQIKLT